jgi:hypothetical protein
MSFGLNARFSIGGKKSHKHMRHGRRWIINI